MSSDKQNDTKAHVEIVDSNIRTQEEQKTAQQRNRLVDSVKIQAITSGCVRKRNQTTKIAAKGNIIPQRAPDRHNIEEKTPTSATEGDHLPIAQQQLEITTIRERLVITATVMTTIMFIKQAV